MGRVVVLGQLSGEEAMKIFPASSVFAQCLRPDSSPGADAGFHVPHCLAILGLNKGPFLNHTDSPYSRGNT